jgi:hypothetical protein
MNDRAEYFLMKPKTGWFVIVALVLAFCLYEAGNRVWWLTTHKVGRFVIMDNQTWAFDTTTGQICDTNLITVGHGKSDGFPNCSELP